MPTYRVNVRQIEVSEVITQYEVIADDPEKAAIFAHYGIKKREFVYDKEYIRTKVRRLDPSTYAVMEAEPLQEMERIQAARRLIPQATAIETWYGDAEEISLPQVEKIKTK